MHDFSLRAAIMGRIAFSRFQAKQSISVLYFRMSRIEWIYSVPLEANGKAGVSAMRIA